MGHGTQTYFRPFAGEFAKVTLKAFSDSGKPPREYDQSDDWQDTERFARSVFSFPVIASVLSIRPKKPTRGPSTVACVNGAASKRLGHNHNRAAQWMRFCEGGYRTTTIHPESGGVE